MDKDCNVVLLDDHPSEHNYIANRISQLTGFKLIGTAFSHSELRTILASEISDILILDLYIYAVNSAGQSKSNLLNWQEQLLAIKKSNPNLKLIVRTAEFRQGLLRTLHDLNVEGYVYKSQNDLPHIDIALKKVASGESYYSMKINVDREEEVSATLKSFLNDLTPRQNEILKLIIDGKSNKQIAAELFLSESTIKDHISNIYDKSYPHNTKHKLMAWYIKNI